MHACFLAMPCSMAPEVGSVTEHITHQWKQKSVPGRPRPMKEYIDEQACK